MTKLCLGTVQFGMDYGIQGNGQPDLSKAIEILTTAYDAGIRTYDTASAYGNAEHVINIFLSQSSIHRKNVRIISKTKSSDLQILNDAKSSLENIGIQYLDGCLLHDADLVFSSNAVQNMRCLKETGMTKEIGVSVYTPEQALKCLDYDFVDIIQVPYNIMDRRLDKCNFFTKAKSLGLDIYVRSVLLQGLLMMNTSKLPPNMKFAEPYIQQYQTICKNNGITTFEGAVGYVLQHGDIDYLVFGVDNLNQLKEYIAYSRKQEEKEIWKIFRGYFTDMPDKLLMPNLWSK